MALYKRPQAERNGGQHRFGACMRDDASYMTAGQPVSPPPFLLMTERAHRQHGSFGICCRRSVRRSLLSLRPYEARQAPFAAPNADDYSDKMTLDPHDSRF